MRAGRAATAARPARAGLGPVAEEGVVAVGSIGHEAVRRTGCRRRRRTISATSRGTGRRAAGRRALGVCRAGLRRPVAHVGDVADARRATAGGAIRQHRVGRAGLVGAVAALGAVAHLADRGRRGTPCCSTRPRRPGRSCWSRRRIRRCRRPRRRSRHGTPWKPARSDRPDSWRSTRCSSPRCRRPRRRSTRGTPSSWAGSRPPGRPRSTLCTIPPRRSRRRRRGTRFPTGRSRRSGSHRWSRRRPRRRRRCQPRRGTPPCSWHPPDRCRSTPSQTSATSQAPAEARHSAVLLASAGQLLPTPSQISARSQAPAEARHSAVLLASAGQSLPTPSQALREVAGARRARHSAELLASAGQSLLDAVAASPRGRRRRAGRGTRAVLLASAGQSSPDAVAGLRAGREAPAEARHFRRALGVRRAGGVDAGAGLGDVTTAGGRPAGGPAVARRMGARAAAVTLVDGAGLAVGGARRQPSVRVEGSCPPRRCRCQACQSPPPVQGSPVCAVQVPLLHVSVPVAEQAVQCQAVSRSGRRGRSCPAASLHDSLRLPSPCPGRGRDCRRGRRSCHRCRCRRRCRRAASVHGAVLFGCWQIGLAPLQVSLVQTLPSSMQPVPFVLNVQAGRAARAGGAVRRPPWSHCSPLRAGVDRRRCRTGW